MTAFLKHMASAVNSLHDGIWELAKSLGFHYGDKWLHFLIMAVVGIILFGGVQIVFKFLAKYSITAISFIYTFTVMAVLVFAIEIQEKITGSGTMEFADIAYGMYGFLCAFSIYLFFKGIVFAVKWFVKRQRTNNQKQEDNRSDL